MSHPNDSAPVAQFDSSNAKVIYLLLMGGIGFIFVSIAAVVWAYVCRDHSVDTVLESHYSNQIRIFWIALCLGIFATLLWVFLVLVSPVLLLFNVLVLVIGAILELALIVGIVVWLFLRCREGLYLLESREPAFEE